MANTDRGQSPLHYRQHFIKDWLSSTTVQRMSLVAKAIYIALLDAQWMQGFLDDDIDELRRIAGASESEWAQFSKFLDHCFPISEDGYRRNERMSDDRERAVSKIETNRKNGGLGGRPKKTESKPNGLANGNRTDNRSPNQQQKPIETQTITQTITETKPITITNNQYPVIVSQQSKEAGAWRGVGEPLPQTGPASESATTTPAPEYLVSRIRQSWSKFPRVEGQAEWPDPGDWAVDYAVRLLKVHEPIKSESDRVFYAEQMLASFDANYEKAPARALGSPKKALESWLTTQRIKVAEIVERAAERKPSGGNSVTNYTDEEWAAKMRTAR